MTQIKMPGEKRAIASIVEKKPSFHTKIKITTVPSKKF
jgi:hypothetical protein